MSHNVIRLPDKFVITDEHKTYINCLSFYVLSCSIKRLMHKTKGLVSKSVFIQIATKCIIALSEQKQLNPGMGDKLGISHSY